MALAQESERRREHEQTRLDLAMGAAQRNRTGQFATPGPLAEEIVRYCLERWQDRRRPVRFLEPCIGTGSFYSALRRVFPAGLIDRANGFEVDPEHADVARSLWHTTGLAVTRTDFLAEPLPRESRYNLLITNPPYVRHHHLERGRKERLQALVRDRLGIKISGLAGLYCYFLLLADAWLEEGGLSVWLIPSEFLDVNYGTAVKEYLTTRVRLMNVHRFCPADVQFDDALVSSAVVVFEKAEPAGQDVVFSVGGSPRHPDRIITLRQELLCPSQKWSQYTEGGTRSAGQRPTGILFGDLFTIKRGLATGNNAFFILPRAQAARLRLPEEFLRPILPAPRRLRDEVIEAGEDGYPCTDPQLVLLDCRLSEPAVRERHAALWRYLEEGRSRHVHETYLTSRRTPWYGQEDRPPPPFLCTYMGRSANGRKPFRFLWNKSRATAPNVYLLLYPKGVLKETLASAPALYERVFAALASVDTASITGSGRVYGGGLYKMEPKELGNISAAFLFEALGLSSGRVQGGLFDGLEMGE